MKVPVNVPEPLYDVRGVNIATNEERLIAWGKDRRNAEACMEMAVIRRGVEVEFFVVVPAGKTWAESREVAS